MDQRFLKTYAAGAAVEDKPEVHDINYPKIHHLSEQLAAWTKQAASQPYVGMEEMDRLCQYGEALQKELYLVRNELIRRKNLELLLPSPNTQHHLPCSSLLSPNSAPSSPTGQQSMALSTSASTSSGNLISPSTTPNGSPSSSPHALALSVDSSSMSTGVMQSDDYWRSRKMDPSKLGVRRSPTPLYVNLTEQMILAQSSKRKRPAEGDLYCHNCNTKDTPEWRRGPKGAKTLCNACGIRWRLSQAEAKQKKGDQSPTSSMTYLHSLSSSQSSPQHSPTQQTPPQLPTHPTQPQQTSVSPPPTAQQQMSMLHQQQQIRLTQLHMQHQMLQHHYATQHTQQHMVLPGHVGLAQENSPSNNGRMGLNPVGSSLSGGDTNRGGPGGAPGAPGASGVMTSLSMAASPIAT